jgi:hypothetical protein
VSNEAVIALATGIPTALAALASLVVGVLNSRQILKVEHATNSMKDALIAAALIEGHAAGVKDEKERALPTSPTLPPASHGSLLDSEPE